MHSVRYPGDHSVSATAYVERASDWARQLEEDEARRSGLDRTEDARPTVARLTGVPAGTLRNLVQKRVKSVSAYAYDRLNQAAVRLLERQLACLKHELDLTRQQGLDPRSDDVQAVLQDIAAVTASLGLSGDAPDGGA